MFGRRAPEPRGVGSRPERREIRGGYALVHAKIGGDDRNWLLVKMKDEGADADGDS